MCALFFRATSAMAGGAKFHDSCYNHGSGGNMVSVFVFKSPPFIARVAPVSAGQIGQSESVAYGR